MGADATARLGLPRWAGAAAPGSGEAVMGAGAGQAPLAVAAWCDPQARTYRLSWADALIGLLIVGGDRIVFATPDRVVVNAPRAESAVEWLGQPA